MQHHRNAFGCQKVCLTVHPAVALWDSLAPSWQKFFSSPILQSVSNERFPSSCSLHQQSFWLVIFDRIKRVLLCMLCWHLSVLLMVVRCTAHLQQGFCLQKTFCGSKRLVLLTLHHLQRPAVVFNFLWWQCHRVKKGGGGGGGGIPLRDVQCLHFHDKVHKHVLTCHAPTPHWGIAKSCHCKWGWRKDKGQRLSVLAVCSIASTAGRKSHYFIVWPHKKIHFQKFRQWYIPIKITWFLDFSHCPVFSTENTHSETAAISFLSRKRREIPMELGPTERTNLSHSTGSTFSSKM